MQGRRAARFFINDNLAWTVGVARIPVRNQQPDLPPERLRFRRRHGPARDLHDSSPVHLRCGVDGIENLSAGQFAAIQLPQPGFLRAGYLESHAHADVDLRRPRHVQFESAESARRRGAPRRVVRCDFPRRESAAEPGDSDAAGNDFRRYAPAILQPRTAIAWQIAPHTVLRSGFGLFSDILPGSVVDLVGTNPPYSKTFQGGLLGTVGGMAIAPGVPNSAIDATAAANQLFNSGFAQGQLSCASALANPKRAFRRFPSPPFRTASCTRPTSCNGALRLEHQIGNDTQSASSVCGHARGQPAL